MTKDDDTVDATPATDVAEEVDDWASGYAETTTTAATVDDDAADAQVVEEEERPPPRLMITKMVRAEAGCISFVSSPLLFALPFASRTPLYGR